MRLLMKIILRFMKRVDATRNLEASKLKEFLSEFKFLVRADSTILLHLW